MFERTKRPSAKKRKVGKLKPPLFVPRPQILFRYLYRILFLALHFSSQPVGAVIGCSSQKTL